MVCAFDLNQIVNEITWSRIYDNQVRSSILDHVYVGDLTMIDWSQVLKQPISDHSVVVVKTVGIENSNDETTYEYSCWRDYAADKLRYELSKYDWKHLKEQGPQETADIMDIVLGSVQDRLIKNVKCNKTKKGFVSSHKHYQN